MGCCELATPLVRAPIIHAAPLPATLHITAAAIPAPHLRHPRALHRHSCAPSSSFLRAVFVIPAQAGMVGEAIGVLEGGLVVARGFPSPT